MKKVKEFHKDASKMLNDSRTTMKIVNEYLSEFAAFDSDFDSALMNAWDAAIEDAIGHSTDETERDELQQFSKEVTVSMEAYAKCMDDIEYYAEKAFAEADEDVLVTFAFDQRAKAMQSMPRFVMWGLVTNKFVLEYQSELLTAGMPAQLLTDMATTFQAFFDAEQVQEKFKRMMKLSTLRRIDKLNKVFAFNRKAHAVAQRIYRHIPEKRGMFALTK
jgi:hypothetical protein